MKSGVKELDLKVLVIENVGFNSLTLGADTVTDLIT